jgi:hypothetical protein
MSFTEAKALELKIPRVRWDEWYAWWPWKQGQHVVITAQTGGGKSNTVRLLMNKRKYGVVLASKKMDDTYDEYIKTGVKRIQKWPPPKPMWNPPAKEFYLLWPEIKAFKDIKKLEAIFRHCLEDLFIDGGWCVILADLFYLSMKLKLMDIITEIQFQIRALGVSELSELQRPRWVPRATWGQSSHTFLQSLSDLDDLAEIRGLYRMSTRELIAATNLLGPYEWLYRNVADPFSKPMILTKPPLIGASK